MSERVRVLAGGPRLAPATLRSNHQQHAPPARVIDSEPDTITLEVIENALRSARFEKDAVVYRTAMSPGIREQRDQFPIIVSPSGDMAVGQFGSFIPGLLRPCSATHTRATPR